MKTADELVRELVDREAIRDLPIRYSDFLFRDDVEGLVSLFTENGSFVVRDPENEVATHGRARLRKMFQQLLGDVFPKPFIHTHVVELGSESSATGRCYVELRSAKVDMDRIGSGYYEDDYVKVGGVWKFATRRLIESGMATSLRTFMVR